MKKIICLSILASLGYNVMASCYGPANCVYKFPVGSSVSVTTKIRVIPQNLVGMGYKILTGFIHIVKTSTNAEVQTLYVNDYYSQNTVLAVDTFTFDLIFPLEPNTNYKVVVDANTFMAEGCQGGDTGGAMPETTWYFTTGSTAEIITNEENIFSVYPNSTTGLINLTAKNNLIGEYIHLYDYNGRIIDRFSIESEVQTFDITKFSKGIYFISFTGNKSPALKIVKE